MIMSLGFSVTSIDFQKLHGACIISPDKRHMLLSHGRFNVENSIYQTTYHFFLIHVVPMLPYEAWGVIPKPL